MPYGLILDVDGVLADTEALLARATIAMFRELYDVEFAPEDFEPYVGADPNGIPWDPPTCADSKSTWRRR